MSDSKLIPILFAAALVSRFALGDTPARSADSSSAQSAGSFPDRHTVVTASSDTSHHATVGMASWYGPGLQGRRTASGERFDSRKMTAASTQLPLRSHAVVTNLKNGRSVKVRVNDCGPSVRGRQIDLSKQAARRLGMIRDGTATVKVEVVDEPAEAPRCDPPQIRSAR